ncbi:MAG: hypothetical protein CMM56_05830 [Rhodospirillaceae bacterium]|nr:hypothetical protein [Rhodospirillaceae bacterium]|tara:strand:+ start:239 stop:448 length:210 start_codon:yes stop_codon:yes gene_type:complete
MSALRSVLTIALLGVFSFASVSQETEEEPEPHSEPAPPPPQPDTRPLDEIFIPSQEIGADEEIVFPVNI